MTAMSGLNTFDPPRRRLSRSLQGAGACSGAGAGAGAGSGACRPPSIAASRVSSADNRASKSFFKSSIAARSAWASGGGCGAACADALTADNATSTNAALVSRCDTAYPPAIRA